MIRETSTYTGEESTFFKVQYIRIRGSAGIKPAHHNRESTETLEKFLHPRPCFRMLFYHFPGHRSNPVGLFAYDRLIPERDVPPVACYMPSFALACVGLRVEFRNHHKKS